MPNLTVTARDIATGDVFDIAGTATMTVHRIDPIGYSHVRIVGSVGDSPVFNPSIAATASVTMPSTRELIITRQATA